MTNVDQFESVFRAASKPVFDYRPIELREVLVVTDLQPQEAAAFADRVRTFLGTTPAAATASYEHLSGVQFRTTGDLLQLVESKRPDLICAYRNLHSDGWKWPHSLGEALDLLTQVASAPVMVLPHPRAGRQADHALKNTNRVMAVTDHLAGDDRLVNWAVALTQEKGRLFLAHVEDERTFARYLDVISKIPALDTDTARRAIRERLLKEPTDYIASCRAALDRTGVRIDVVPEVTLGHRLSDYQRLVDEHEVDLLVLNTKDEDQLAMHGLAYPIAVELRNIPLLML